MTIDPNRLMIAILAGGEGTRMGGDKPSRELGGTSLIERTIGMASTWSVEVRVVLRRQSQLKRPVTRVILDDPTIEGPLGGLAAALRTAQAGGHRLVMTVPCDILALPEDLPDRLLGALRDALAVIARDDRGVHPVCALWRAEAIDHLPAYLATGRRSLLGFAEMAGCNQARFPGDRFFNLNTSTDLAEAERRLADTKKGGPERDRP